MRRIFHSIGDENQREMIWFLTRNANIKPHHTKYGLLAGYIANERVMVTAQKMKHYI